MRIDKYLSNLGHGSRKDIKRLIRNKIVKVNNVIINSSGLIIDPAVDVVTLDQEIIKTRENIVIILNKPKGYISSRIDELYPSVLNLIKEPYDQYDLKIAGRLDQDTEGLLILTNNNDLLHKLTHPNYNLSKTYEVELARELESVDITKLEEGVTLLDSRKREYQAVALNLKYINDTDLTKCEITITTGKYHQVKRMFQKINNKVINLKRIKIGTVNLEDYNLKIGSYQVVKLEEFKYD